MSKKSPPPPDYASAAKAEGEQDQLLSTQQNFANRPNITTPWGQQTWETSSGIDPSTGKPITKWNSNIALSPAEQDALTAQQQITAGKSGAAQQLLGQATAATANPMDWGGMPARADQINAPGLVGRENLPGVSTPNTSYSTGDIGVGTVNPFGFGNINTTVNPRESQKTLGDAGQIQSSLARSPGDYRDIAQEAVWERQKPALDARRAAVETQLANQGLARGSEAWNREMEAVNDAEDRARLAAISEGRVESSQLFGQDLSAGQFANSAQGQQFGQNVTAGTFFNQGQGQDFTQDVGSAVLNNQAQAQAFGQGAQAVGINNAAALQQAGMNRDVASFENTAAAAEFQQLMQRVQAGDARALQELQAQVAAGSFNNANRTGAINETIQQRGQPLNELNALLTGSQVSMPQFPNPANAGRAQTTDLTGAMQNQYGADLDASNARNAATNSAMSSAAMVAAMYFSDARLKEDISTVGILSSGVRVVHYRYRGLPTRYIGVIAQEVLKVIPEAVHEHPSGYLMVDYSKVH